MKLPKNWRAIEQAGEVLYLQRLCGRYYVLPECSEWHAYFDIEGSAPFGGKPIGKHRNYEGALLIWPRFEVRLSNGLDLLAPMEAAAMTRPAAGKPKPHKLIAFDRTIAITWINPTPLRRAINEANAKLAQQQSASAEAIRRAPR